MLVDTDTFREIEELLDSASSFGPPCQGTVLCVSAAIPCPLTIMLRVISNANANRLAFQIFLACNSDSQPWTQSLMLWWHPTITLYLPLISNCNSATVMTHHVNICGFPMVSVKGSLDLHRVRDPQVENYCFILSRFGFFCCCFSIFP